MLREGLATEFPLAKRAIVRLSASLRSAELSREAPVWAAVSAVGAGWAVQAVGQVLSTATRSAGLYDPASWVSAAFTILGYAIAVGVAVRAGGRRGFTWYLAILVVRLATQAAMTLSGIGEFCARSAELCPTALRFALPYLYVAAGLAAGALAIRVLRAGPEGRNVFLNGAGAYAMFGTPVSLAFFLVRPQDLVSASAMDFALNGVAALIAGVVLRLRSPRLTPTALLAGAMVLIWLVSVGPFLLSLGQSGASQPASLYISGLTQALLLGIAWSVTDRAQRARTTAAA